MLSQTHLRCIAVILFTLSFPAGSEPAVETLTRDDVEILYAAPVTQAMAADVAARVLLSKRRVLAYLRQSEVYPDDRADIKIRVLIDPEASTPSQMRASIFLPQERVLAFFDARSPADVSLAITHEVTHVLAVSANRANRNRFLDDGLAVFLQAELDELPAYPNFHHGLHIATANGQLERGDLLAFEDTEATRRRPSGSLDLKMAYLQQGSFTQFLLESYGLDAYLRHYYGQPAEAAFGQSLVALDAKWRAFIESLGAEKFNADDDGTSS